MCKPCSSKQVAPLVHADREKKREWTRQYRKENPCSKCGESRWYVLDFHHVESSEKEKGITQMANSSATLEKIKKEVDKCIILCSNCHRELHYLDVCAIG